jgi:hypothetical protein
MKKITTQAELVALAQGLGVRPDWHEPDEQRITARVHGQSFDNAMPVAEWYGADVDGSPRAELYVVLYREPSWSDQYGSQPVPKAAVNLADLFAWATFGGNAATITQAGEESERLLGLARDDWSTLRVRLQEVLGIDETAGPFPVPSVPEMVERLISIAAPAWAVGESAGPELIDQLARVTKERDAYANEAHRLGEFANAKVQELKELHRRAAQGPATCASRGMAPSGGFLTCDQAKGHFPDTPHCAGASDNLCWYGTEPAWLVTPPRQ